MKILGFHRTKKVDNRTELEKKGKVHRAEFIIDNAIKHGWKGSKRRVLEEANSINQVQKLIGIYGNPSDET